MKKLSGLTIFFPFYNDAGTVGQAITDAYRYGRELTHDLEVIAIHGGNSKDHTWDTIQKQKRLHKDLIVIDKHDNSESYAVIKHGLYRATKEWVFYTDGDLQYDLSDLKRLVEAHHKTGADVINGYKTQRRDARKRVFLGNLYKRISAVLFRLPIQDLTCDFRLIRRSFLKPIELRAKDASILPELIKKLENQKARFAEIPVRHSPRTYGRSTYTLQKLLRERLIGDLKLILGMYNKEV